MVIDDGKLGWRISRPSNSFFSTLLRRTPLQYVALDSIHARMSPGIGHVRCETQYRLLAVQEFPIPVDPQHAPAAFDRVVLAMVRRVVHQF